MRDVCRLTMHDNTHCELLSQMDGLKFRENISEEIIAEWPHSWPKGEISYRLNNRSTDLNECHQTRAVTVALLAWQLRIDNLKFRRERNPSVPVDFEVSFEKHDKFKSKNVLAHAWFPGQGDISGDCEINDEDWEWVASVNGSSLRRPPLTSVLIHEFGHSLGLRHDTSRADSIMYPSLDMGDPRVTLGKSDITRIQLRYGKRRLSKRLVDYFALRRIRGYDFR